jgi:OPA family glycerol-3-phosphate transporter-like MFS transporter
MFAFFRPAAHQAALPEEKIDSTYRRLRWQIFAGIFIGYAGYYLLRKNFSLAMPYLIDEGYTRGQLGLAMSAWCPTAPTRAISYRSACWYQPG